MLIYVIPLILLIIVLLVVKKRQDAQGAEKPKAAIAKNKKTVSSARSAPQKSPVVTETAPQPQTAVPLAADLRKKIEHLIHAGNFFAAEAQINQALKKDNRQHALYLLLLDIHIQQHDEFAISQLMNHISSLGLNEVLAQAESKKADFEKSLNSAKDTIDFPAAPSAPVAEAPIVDNSAAFAALSPTQHPAQTSDFDLLQQDHPPQQTVLTPAQDDIQPLEFNFTPASSAAETAPTPAQTKTEEKLEFDFKSLHAEPGKSEPEPTTPSFDFESFNTSSPSTPSTAEAALPPIQEHDLSTETELPSFDFNAENKFAPQGTEPAEKPQEIAPLDFSFAVDDSATPAPEEQSTAVPEFNLSSLDSTEPSQSTNTAVEGVDPDFKLDTAPEKPASAALHFAIPETPVVAVADPNDPLIQSFPELSASNEIVLNLELAEQYIQLGAYEAARDILAEKQADYSPQQQAQADQLLNQIAS